jgi:hypothetical protein
VFLSMKASPKMKKLGMAMAMAMALAWVRLQ